jgi:hypothetical protein
MPLRPPVGLATKPTWIRRRFPCDRSMADTLPIADEMLVGWVPATSPCPMYRCSSRPHTTSAVSTDSVKPAKVLVSDRPVTADLEPRRQRWFE